MAKATSTQGTATPAKRKPATRTTRSRPAGSGANPTGTDDTLRQRMIAEAAYYRAEKRGFEPGYEDADWLAAEQEIKASSPSAG